MLKSTDTLRIHLSAIALALSGVFFCPLSLYPTVLWRIIHTGSSGICFLLVGFRTLIGNGCICITRVGITWSLRSPISNNGRAPGDSGTSFDLDWGRTDPSILWSWDFWLACNRPEGHQREESCSPFTRKFDPFARGTGVLPTGTRTSRSWYYLIRDCHSEIR